jgi:hypothetical protein
MSKPLRPRSMPAVTDVLLIGDVA